MPTLKTRSSKRALPTKRPHNQPLSVAREYPFSAIIGQEEMKLALILNAIDPLIGGVLIMGHRGTGKSTAVRGLAQLLPEIRVVRNCPFNCDPLDAGNLCAQCKTKLSSGNRLTATRSSVRVVELPLGATEDRICGTIDVERALKEGDKVYEPGLLARANRGFLYIDEVNLLEDHLVDLLLDAAATGRSRVEREGISVEHPARFVLVGSGNPEEGELRPQLQDRFGLHVAVTTDHDLDARIGVIENREAFERDPDGFLLAAKPEQDRLRRTILRARRNYLTVTHDRSLLRNIAQLCSDLKIDGHRGELTITRAGKALAAFEGRGHMTPGDVKRVAPMALRHRLRRDALEETEGSERIEQAVERLFSPNTFEQSKASGDEGELPTSSASAEAAEAVGATSTRGRIAGPRATSSTPSGEVGAEAFQKMAVSAAANSRMPELELHEPNRLLHRSNNERASISRERSKTSTTSRNRGHYTRAVKQKTAKVAVNATLRAAAHKLSLKTTAVSAARLQITSDALRYKLFATKTSSLFIFAIDTSGSMALTRINQAKAAILKLLKTSYINRDRVAIVAFGGSRATLVLPPCRSMLRARRVLETLSLGGGTPLSAALACSLKIARRVSSQDRGQTTLLLFTDGRANISLQRDGSGPNSNLQSRIDKEIKALGMELQRADVRTIVVETQNRFVSSTRARGLANALSAQHIQLASAMTPDHIAND